MPGIPEPEPGPLISLTFSGMVRKLKYHEQKLLRKVDFIQWRKTDNVRESQVLRRYHITGREDYVVYNKICGYVTKLANQISLLDPSDPFRAKAAKQLLDKLYDEGLLANKNTLSQIERFTVSSICRRRLATVMTKLKMSETVKEAVTFIEQGHVRVGPETVTNPAFHVSRNMEDFVTWVDASKIKRKILQYNDKLDDYDLL